MFWAIEINVVLWFAAIPCMMGWVDVAPKWLLPMIGVGFAALLQHWAYYRLYLGVPPSSE